MSAVCAETLQVLDLELAGLRKLVLACSWYMECGGLNPLVGSGHIARRFNYCPPLKELVLNYMFTP